MKAIKPHTPTVGICRMLHNLQHYGSLSNKQVIEDYCISYRTLQRYVESMSLAGYNVRLNRGYIILEQ